MNEWMNENDDLGFGRQGWSEIDQRCSQTEDCHWTKRGVLNLFFVSGSSFSSSAIWFDL